jgi:hypothetical protein
MCGRSIGVVESEVERPMDGNDFALQFLADVYRRTDIQDEQALQHALQAFADELKPWLHPQGPADYPSGALCPLRAYTYCLLLSRFR